MSYSTAFSSSLRTLARRSLASRAPAARNRRCISTINPDEVSHFASLSKTWWDEQGDFNVLQRMNTVRVEFLRERLAMVAQGRKIAADAEAELLKIQGPRFLQGKRVLDVGCGGGLFAERLARLGATTVAIDASEENVKTAIVHASQDPHLFSLMESGQLQYRASAAENLLHAAEPTESSSTSASKEQFDIVCAMEVIEHVSDPPSFLRCLADLTKPGGHLILSTISRTALADLVVIKLAESPLLKFAPPGSHTLSQFIKPDELIAFVENDLGWNASAAAPSGHLTPDQRSARANIEVRGTTYAPWNGEWTLLAKDDPQQSSVLRELRKSCNYFFGAIKPEDK